MQGNGVGEGWTAFASSGYSASYNVVSDIVHGGSKSQRINAPQPPGSYYYAGVYQVISTTADVDYTVSAWARKRCGLTASGFRSAATSAVARASSGWPKAR